MLEGLLGRRFSSKCKSLIKLTKERIHVIRRKRNAREKFLKKDLADLLADGLDVNVFGRAGGLVADMHFSSCYDFVEQSCECILKHLSIMQKQSECPEECRVAVSSLMLAAARFSDLPELCDLRHIFQEKYEKSLEYFADQEFAENLASKPPTSEEKVMLLQGIASEFSVKWDFRAFKQRMSKPPASSSNHLKINESIHPDDKFNLRNDAKQNQCKFPNAKESTLISDRLDASAKDMHVQTIERDCNASKRDDNPLSVGGHVSKHRLPDDRESTFLKKENCYVPFRRRRESMTDRHELWNLEEQNAASTGRSGSSSHGKTLEGICGGYKLHTNSRENTVFKRDGSDTSSRGELELAPSPKLPVRSSGNDHKIANLVKEVEEEDNEKTKPPQNNPIPPPYHKSRRTKTKTAGFHCSNTASQGEPDLASRTELPLGSDGNEQKVANLVGEVQKEEKERTKSSYNTSAPLPYQKSRLTATRNAGFDRIDTTSHGELVVTPRTELPVKSSRNEHKVANLVREVQEEERERMKKPPYSISVSPPNQKSRRSLSRNAGFDHNGTPLDLSMHIGNDAGCGYERQVVGPPGLDSHEDDMRRRRRSKLPPNLDDHGTIEDVGVPKRNPTSRRRNKSAQGLHTVFEDVSVHHRKDEEERLMDKLLFHYSHKPSSYNLEKALLKTDGPQANPMMFPPPSRSVSLPSEETAHLEAARVFTRADFLQLARHVHPKLPDYDDLAARFAALKAG